MFRFVFYTIVILPILYVAGIGPAIAMRISSGKMVFCTDYGMAGTFYRPLFELAKQNIYMDHAIDEYIRFCTIFF